MWIESALSLVVGNTLRLGGSGLLRGEGQHQQGDDIGMGPLVRPARRHADHNGLGLEEAQQLPGGGGQRPQRGNPDGIAGYGGCLQ